MNEPSFIGDCEVCRAEKVPVCTNDKGVTHCDDEHAMECYIRCVVRKKRKS